MSRRTDHKQVNVENSAPRYESLALTFINPQGVIRQIELPEDAVAGVRNRGGQDFRKSKIHWADLDAATTIPNGNAYGLHCLVFHGRSIA